ncbi:MAG TPA: hypothetical protein PLD54_03020, partial [Candidatus Levybacteria bacterium]|nr:hypothetical protein [Candidatus Levybacteria bacterium]
MKKLISSLFFISFFVLAIPAFAADLDVTCVTAICSVSSKDPIFTSDINWIPEYTAQKTVEIVNQDTKTKEIFMRITRTGSQGSLDEYMYITIGRQGQPTALWEGNLKDLLAQHTISLGNLGANNTLMLDVTARMDTQTPNSVQGTSSTFDFGFGFEDEGDSNNGNTGNTGNNSNNNSGNNSNTNSNQSSGGGNTNISSTDQSSNTGTVAGIVSRGLVGSILGLFTDEVEATGTESADVVQQKTKSVKKDIFGATDAECRVNYSWVLFIILQIITAVVLFKKKLKNAQKIRIMLYTLTFLASVVAIYFSSCQLWMVLIAFGIFSL